jgi:hypothetical protein
MLPSLALEPVANRLRLGQFRLEVCCPLGLAAIPQSFNSCLNLLQSSCGERAVASAFGNQGHGHTLIADGRCPVERNPLARELTQRVAIGCDSILQLCCPGLPFAQFLERIA